MLSLYERFSLLLICSAKSLLDRIQHCITTSVFNELATSMLVFLLLIWEERLLGKVAQFFWVGYFFCQLTKKCKSAERKKS